MNRNVRNIVACLAVSTAGLSAAHAAASVSLRELQGQMTDARMKLSEVQETIQFLDTEIAYTERLILESQDSYDETGSDRYLTVIDAAIHQLSQLTAERLTAWQDAQRLQAEIDRLAKAIADMQKSTDRRARVREPLATCGVVP